MASAKSLTGLIKFIRRPDFAIEMDQVLAEHLGPACNRHEIEPAEIANILDQGFANALWGCALEDYMARQSLPGLPNVVDEYIKRRGFQESTGNKRYMKAVRNSVMSLYEASDIVPGESFLARDLVRGGEPVRVCEQSGTRQLKQWDRLAVRLINLGEQWQMAGGALLFDRALSETMLEELADMMRKIPGEFRKIADETFGSKAPGRIEKVLASCEPLALCAPLFTTVWLDKALDRMLNPQLPTLQTTEGHAFALCTMRFTLAEGVKAPAVRKALAAIPDIHQMTARTFNWRRPLKPDLQQAPAPKAIALTISSTHSSGETNLADIEIAKDAIIVSTNSRERSAAAGALIGPALGTLVTGQPTFEALTAEEAIAAKSDKPKPAKSRQAKPVPPDEARVIIHAHLDQHYAKTLDEPLPALGNISPRAAVKTPKGRADVIGWLKGLENHMSHAKDDPLATYDTSWLWHELGIKEQRV